MTSCISKASCAVIVGGMAIILSLGMITLAIESVANLFGFSIR